MSDGGTTEIRAWTPAKATERLRAMARSGTLKLHWTGAVKEKLKLIDLSMGDALHVLESGFVHQPSVPASRNGMFKYCMEAPTPNSNNRIVRVVVIPSEQKGVVKIVDVQWVDDPMIRS